MLHLPDVLPNGLAFVDIETTGGPAQRPSITEVAIIELDEDGIREWSSLVKPAGHIPEHIERLTGISNEMVADAPSFAEIADAVYDRLEGRLFVAHNARFDYSHLRAAFRRIGMDMRPRVLCTVKLSRLLFPDQSGHSLDKLVARHQLQVSARHRALGDAQLLWQFWQVLHDRFTPAQIQAAVRKLIGQATLPPHLDPKTIDAIPDRAGVYLFYGENDLPLYVGKSTQLRTRVLAHFSADHQSDRELSLTQQVRRIEWREHRGELGALLDEACLVKQLQPTHNRALRRQRDLCAWRLDHDLMGDPQLHLVHADALKFGVNDQLYGMFRSRREATNQLLALARAHQLCPPLLGLEKKPQRTGRCFSHQLKQCRGACSGAETHAAHSIRLYEALATLKLAAWPYPGPIGLREAEDIHLVDGWRYLGTAHDESEVTGILQKGKPQFDMDIYRILQRGLRTLPALDVSGHANLNEPLSPSLQYP